MTTPPSDHIQARSPSAPPGADGSQRSSADHNLSDNLGIPSASFLIHVLSSISDPLFIKDQQHRWVFVNDALCALMNQTQENLIGKSDHDFFPTHEADFFWSRDEYVFQTGEVSEDEECLTDGNGRQRYVLTKKSILRDEEGRLFLIGTIRDISARKETEETLNRLNEELEQRVEERTAALRDSEVRLRAVFSAAPVMLFATDPWGRVVFLEGRMLEAMGIDSQAMVGEPAVALYANDAKADRAIARALAGREASYTSQFEALFFENRFSPIQNEAGEILGVIGVALDISVRKQIEQQLRNSEQLLQRVIDTIPQEIFWKSRDLVYLGCNETFAKRAGLRSPQDIVGQTDHDLPWRANEAQHYHQQDRLVIETGQSIIHRVESRINQEGREICCDINKLPVYNAEGHFMALLGTVEDITERKQAEQQLMASEAHLRQQTQELEQALQELRRTQVQLVQSEKMSSLGQLVAGVAHEINNPVNFIYANIAHARNYARELIDLLALYHQYFPDASPAIQERIAAIDLKFLTEDFPKLLRSMEIGANRIKRIVNSLRTFSRMDESETKAIDIHAGIESTLLILQHRIKETPERPAIEIIRNYGDLPLAECYGGQLNQVFMNILSNAIDALEDAYQKRRGDRPPLQPTIAIQTRWLKGGMQPGQTHLPTANGSDLNRAELPRGEGSLSDRIVISIQDNGSGIDPKIQHRLFDPFFTTKPIGKGTGMGLSISYEIIAQKHGGRLTCDSIPGRGTTFFIEIPTRLRIAGAGQSNGSDASP